MLRPVSSALAVKRSDSKRLDDFGETTGLIIWRVRRYDVSRGDCLTKNARNDDAARTKLKRDSFSSDVAVTGIFFSYGTSFDFVDYTPYTPIPQTAPYYGANIGVVLTSCVCFVFIA